MLYVLDLNKNLFPVGVCMNKCYNVYFKGNCVKLFLNNTLRTRDLKCNNNLFYMCFKVRSKNDACLATTTNMRRWHERLGHVNYKFIRHICKEGLIKDSISKDIKEMDDLFCEACQYNNIDYHSSTFRHT